MLFVLGIRHGRPGKVKESYAGVTEPGQLWEGSPGQLRMASTVQSVKVFLSQTSQWLDSPKSYF